MTGIHSFRKYMFLGGEHARLRVKEEGKHRSQEQGEGDGSGVEGRTTLDVGGKEGGSQAARAPPGKDCTRMGQSSLLSTKCFAVFWFQIPRKAEPAEGPPGEPGHSQAGEILSCSWSHAHQQWVRHPKDRGCPWFLYLLLCSWN